mmetsp:Transcript_1862/g.3807  ORF Transcript_1862/g.3807 Transcript_1862/m.3807 type:complete len:905 (-) Transcript_1862:819-3533(-)
MTTTSQSVASWVSFPQPLRRLFRTESVITLSALALSYSHFIFWDTSPPRSTGELSEFSSHCILTQSILLILSSSLCYYVIASILSVSPPTSGLGLLLLRRVHDAKLNWHAHIIRSILESGFWVSVIGFTYLRSGSLETNDTCVSANDNSCSFAPSGDYETVDKRWLTAVGLGTVSGLGVVLLGDIWARYLAKYVCRITTFEVRIKFAESGKVFRPKGNDKFAGDDETASLKSASSRSDGSLCDDHLQNTIFATFRSFAILYMLSFWGYHTLSFIFRLPFPDSLSIQSDTPKIHYVLANTLLIHLALATLAGVTFTATANILMRLSQTEDMGEILLKRVSHAGENWRGHPMRSMQELSVWLMAVGGIFHLKHSSGSDDSFGTFWALVWALQLGTMVACVLILGRHYWFTNQNQFEGSVQGNNPLQERNNEKEVGSQNISPLKSVPSDSICSVRENARNEGLVLLDGNWYSVGKFVPHHPGGADVLEQYLGADISLVFRVMHRNSDRILKYRKPLRSATSEEIQALTARRKDLCKEMMEEYQQNIEMVTKAKPNMPKNFDLEAFEKDSRLLYQRFLENGYFRPTLLWFIGKMLFTLCFFLLSITCMKLIPSSSVFSFIFPGIFLGLFWHQSGFLMHDAEHHNLSGDERCNDILGWLFGTVFIGVNGAWWREEHREHHAFLNTFDDEKGFKDPQMREDIWIQNKNLIKFYGNELIHFFVNFQHILFLVVIAVAGRVGIMIDSILTERKFRPWTKLGNILHLLLHYSILSQTNHPVSVFIVGALWQSILSLQLLGNHYTKPWNKIYAATEGNFFVWQILATQDFACPIWLQWFYGGLNFHYSHHLFPTLSREYFHITTPLIKELCDKHGLPFVQVGFFQCIGEMIVNFNEVRKEFSKCGRGSVALMYT